MVVIACVFRPLLWSSIAPEMGRARGLARASWTRLPDRGGLDHDDDRARGGGAADLQPHDRARRGRPLFRRRAGEGGPLSVAIALVTVWAAIALGYLTDWPIGFFVGALGAVGYGTGRLYAWLRRTRRVPAGTTKMMEA